MIDFDPNQCRDGKAPWTEMDAPLARILRGVGIALVLLVAGLFFVLSFGADGGLR